MAKKLAPKMHQSNAGCGDTALDQIAMTGRRERILGALVLGPVERWENPPTNWTYSKSQAHFFFVAWSKAGVASATGGKSLACIRSHGLQALMMARLFHSCFLSLSADEIIGSSGLLQHCRRISISFAGSERVLMAQMTSSLFDGSISSSTTME